MLRPKFRYRLEVFGAYDVTEKLKGCLGILVRVTRVLDWLWSGRGIRGLACVAAKIAGLVHDWSRTITGKLVNFALLNIRSLPADRRA
jgi:hypothetical protein